MRSLFSTVYIYCRIGNSIPIDKSQSNTPHKCRGKDQQRLILYLEGAFHK